MGNGNRTSPGEKLYEEMLMKEEGIQTLNGSLTASCAGKTSAYDSFFQSSLFTHRGLHRHAGVKRLLRAQIQLHISFQMDFPVFIKKISSFLRLFILRTVKIPKRTLI